jgi:STE24 endopeptidase
VQDNFALRLGYGEELAAALIKLQVKNLSAMDADYLYSSYHYSHPILTERLKAIGWKGDKKVESKVQDGSASRYQDSEKPLKAADREL